MAGEAERLAKEFAEAQAELERIQAEAYADGLVTAEQQSRIEQAEANLAVAEARAELAEEEAKAYADGIVSEEEQARIAQAQANLADAKEHADSVASQAEDNAKQFAVDEDDKVRTEAQGYADTAENNAKNHADQVAEDRSNEALQQALAESVAKDAYDTKMAQIADELGEKAGIEYVDGQLVSAIEGIEIGERNLVLGTSSDFRTASHNQWYAQIQIINLDDVGLQPNDVVTFSLYAKTNSEGGARARLRWEDAETGANVAHDNGTQISENSEGRIYVTGTVPSDATRVRLVMNNVNNSNPYTSEYKEAMFQRGNKATDWTPAPEDIQAEIDEKAQTDDLEDLAGIVSDIASQVDEKAPIGELQQLLDEFNERVQQDILDKEQLATDLATIEGRTALVEILANDNKLITQFVDTVITESDEGIFIGNKQNDTGVFIASDRISFLDNKTEVAYISNQTMQISHGIFVESAIISGFKFEKIPGTEILSITWVGDD